jgi:tRNA A37 threonylcarbamoyladenosine biosynthesis protein TsaE
LAEGISLIEWPERLGPLLPEEHLLLGLDPGARPTARIARLEATAGWAQRLQGIGHG